MERSQFDLHLRLFGIHIIVLPFFWLFCLLIGYQYLSPNPLVFVTLVACIFASLLVHEMGHGLAFRGFGCYHVTIVLQMFGGYATGQPGLRSRRQRILATLAGPAAGFLFAAIVYGSEQAFGWKGTSVYTALAYTWLLWFNIVWGLINLMPIWPLDGGQISRELFIKYNPWQGIPRSLMLSMIAAGAIVFISLNAEFNFAPELRAFLWFWPTGLYSAILFGILLAQNYQEYQALKSYGGYDDGPPWR